MIIYLALSIVFLCSPLRQGEDVALPEVPTEPLPEVPEAAKAEPGTARLCLTKGKPERRWFYQGRSTDW